MNKYKLILLIFILTIVNLGRFITLEVNAQTDYDPPASCGGESPPPAEELTVDTNCQLRKIEDPTTECQVVVCKNAFDPSTSEPPLVYEKLVTFFGDQAIYIRSEEQIAGVINLAVTSFLAITSVFAAIYGVYVAGVKRAQTTNEEEIIKYNKTLVFLIIGFVVAWGFIFIMQFVANILGLGSLNDLVILSNPSDTTDSSVIVIE